MTNFFFNLAAMSLCAFLPLLVYAIRRADNFLVDLFLIQNKTRLILGMILVLCVSAGMSFVPDFVEILTLLNISPTGSSAALIGAAIGLFMVSAMKSDK